MNDFIDVHFIVFILLMVLLGKSDERSPKNIFPGHYRVFKTNDCSKNLDVYQPNSNGEWPAKVVSSKYITYRQKTQKLEIIWKADIKNIKGFKIVLKPSGKPDICRILDYTGSITNSSSGMYNFQFKMDDIYKYRNFTAELCPLPCRDNTSVLTSNFDTVDCSLFTPKFTQDYDGRILNVTFSKGPDICNYQKYEIGVYNNENKKRITRMIVPTQKNVDKLQAYFELSICKGNYYIMASVFDESPNSCICRNKQQKCQNCLYSISETMYLVPERRCSPKILQHENQKPKKTDFPLVIVMGILLLITLALTITHWKLSVHLMVKKRGIVLLLDDHEHHTNAVSKLINYLNESHLKVLLGSALVKNPDTPDQLRLIVEILKADFVLLVLSSALQKRMAAWDKHQDYVDFFKERNSNIITKILLEMLLTSNNLYVCKFDHVAEFGNWPKPCYSLPSNLSNMVADLNGQTYSQRLALCNCFKSKTLWNEFQTAIKKACIYEQSHVNWFQEKYVCPTNQPVLHFITDETSQESFSQYTYPNALKLKELFTGYKNNYPNLPEEHVITPSVFSEPISEKLEAINNRNL